MNPAEIEHAPPSPPNPSPYQCPKCGTANDPHEHASAPAYVYAVGRIEPRFPRLSIEREFNQIVAKADTKGLTDRQTMQTVLAKTENRYLVRQLCWLMTIGGLETYIVVPRDPHDLKLLVETLRPNPRPSDLDVVIGMKGPIAPPELCNGTTLPMVGFDHIYSFDRDDLIKSIPRPSKVNEKEFQAAATEVFERVAQMTDNAGTTDEHRALNYLAVRYDAIYARTAAAFSENAALSAVDVRPSLLGGVRRVVDVIFSYTSRATQVVEKYSVRVDVTEEFPFLVSRMGPYFDR